jgi:hypothetical protein
MQLTSLTSAMDTAASARAPIAVFLTISYPTRFIAESSKNAGLSVSHDALSADKDGLRFEERSLVEECLRHYDSCRRAVAGRTALQLRQWALNHRRVQNPIHCIGIPELRIWVITVNARG